MSTRAWSRIVAGILLLAVVLVIFRDGPLLFAQMTSGATLTVLRGAAAVRKADGTPLSPAASGLTIFIGTEATATNALENGGSGVVISAGDTDFTNNIISGNHDHGVALGPLAGATEFHGNVIGQGFAPSVAIANGQDGINSQADDVIVGTWPGPDNVIRFNKGFGIVVDGGTGNTIRGNAMVANGQGLPPGTRAGIDLRNGGNDNIREPDSLQILVGSPISAPYRLRFETFGSLACYNGPTVGNGTCIVDVYKSVVGMVEGEEPADPLATSNTVDGPGFQTITLPPSVKNTRIVITITDGANTSKFSTSVIVPP